MQDIQKIDQQIVAVQFDLLKESNSSHIALGRIIVGSDCFYRIVGIDFGVKYVEGQPIEDRTKLRVHREKSSDLGKTWKDYGYESLEDFNRYNSPSSFLTMSIEEYLKEVQGIMSGEIALVEYDDNQDISEETGLMHVKSKEYLSSLKDSMEVRRQRAELMAKGVGLQLEAKRRELEKLKDNLNAIALSFKKKVEQIEKVIWTIELYLGIEEDIVQIQDGPSAGVNDAINFWQRTGYMDEEVGDPMNDRKGLDFNSIQDFDSWVLKYSPFYKKFNYELLIPQQKGLITLRVRREKKQYSDNPWLNAMINQENMKTYILIRNGQRLYRIWGDITIHPKLFPNRDELQELKDKWDYLVDREEGKDVKLLEERFNPNNNLWQGDITKEKEAINNQLFKYKQYMIMLQGLLDRTEIFHPVPTNINLMSTEALENNYVNFVYEDSLKLTDGRLSFSAWQKSINKGLSVGDRVAFVTIPTYEAHKHENITERFDKRYHRSWQNSLYSIPDLPDSALYVLHEYKTEERRQVTALANSWQEVPEYVKKCYIEGYFDEPQVGKKDRWGSTQQYATYPFEYKIRDHKDNSVYETKVYSYTVIKYNPGGEVRNNWDYYDDGHERKNQLSYKIFETDSNVLNFDAITMDDINYYLFERRHRVEYLHMMPVLYNIKVLKEQEAAKELEFVKGLVEDMKRKHQKLSDPRKEIWEAIEWYKLKNKSKRALTERDDLAWRMIKKRLKLEI